MSFSLWPQGNKLMHSYYEKGMRNQTLVVERSAMSRQSIMSIMSNELVRRLQVLDESLEKKEVIEVIDKYVPQLKNSEYNWKQSRDIVVSALKGFQRKEMIRKAEKKPKFRTGKQSLKARVDKKLTEKEKWFRKKKLSEDAENIENSEKKEKKGSSWKHYRCKKPRISALEEVSKEESPAKAVLFVQNTAGSELAGQIR